MYKKGFNMQKTNQLILPCMAPIKEDEIDTVAKLDTLSSLTPWNFNQYSASYKNPHHKIYTIVDHSISDKIIGCVVWSIVFDEMEILQFYIVNEYKQKGIGYYSLGFIISDIAHEFKINKIFLEVACNNIPAIKLYTKLNFVIMSTRKNYYLINGVRCDAYIMTLTI